MGQQTERNWINIEYLRMAFQIEEAKKRHRIFYVDVGDLPKLKAEQYVKDVMASFQNDKNKDYWIPRRKDGRGTEVTVAPAPITLEDVLKTASKLKEFVEA